MRVGAYAARRGEPREFCVVATEPEEIEAIRYGLLKDVAPDASRRWVLATGFLSRKQAEEWMNGRGKRKVEDAIRRLREMGAGQEGGSSGDQLL